MGENQNMNYLDVTPLNISDLNPRRFDIVDLTDALSVLRITMIQNLTTLAEETLTTIAETKDLTTKLELTKTVRSMYSEINKITSELEDVYAVQGVPFVKQTLITRHEAPFMDFDKRKTRAQTWLDYLAWCSMTETPPLHKGELFRLILKHRFREGGTGGNVTFIPPGVR